jgi:hypothetical protein
MRSWTTFAARRRGEGRGIGRPVLRRVVFTAQLAGRCCHQATTLSHTHLLAERRLVRMGGDEAELAVLEERIEQLEARIGGRPGLVVHIAYCIVHSA